MTNIVTIRDVKVILTAPEGINLVVVKIETSEPGLYGLGCATFTQRYLLVKTAIEDYLRDFLIGKDVANIEDIWQTSMVNSYWRNGPALNNALSGVDMALWDIAGKRAGMPVYDLLGGKTREGAAIYRHADGKSLGEVEENVRKFMDQGLLYIRCQMGGYGGRIHDIRKPEGAPPGAYFDPIAYSRDTVRLFEHMRSTVGDEIELLHDVHERLAPIEAVRLSKNLEPYRLFFLEDALAPESIDWFRMMRAQSATPIGPGDVSPVGHTANLHLDVSSANFGVQEWWGPTDIIYDMFPGTPEVRNGYAYPNDRPGLGIDIDEALAAKFPCDNTQSVRPPGWTTSRTPDGGSWRP